MNRRVLKLIGLIAIGLVLGVVLHALAQQGGARPPAGGFPGGGFPAMMPGFMMPAPMAVMVAEDGVIYVACDGTLTAFEAKTLKPLGAVTYWTRPEADQ